MTSVLSALDASGRLSSALNTNSVVEQLAILVSDVIDKKDVQVSFTLGSIFGKYVHRKVNLPIVGNPVVLENSNTFEFIEALSKSSFKHIERLLKQQEGNDQDDLPYEVTSRDATYEEYFFADKFIGHDTVRDTYIGCINETLIGEQTIFFPSQDYHMRLEMTIRPRCNVTKEDLYKGTETAPRRLRDVNSYIFKYKGSHALSTIPRPAPTVGADGKKSKAKAPPVRSFVINMQYIRQVKEDDDGAQEDLWRIRVLPDLEYLKALNASLGRKAVVAFVEEMIQCANRMIVRATLVDREEIRLIRGAEKAKLDKETKDSSSSSENDEDDNEDDESSSSSSSSSDEADGYFFPNFIGDIAAHTKKHYDDKRTGVAAGTELEGLRKCNNEVKRVLIELYVPTGGAKVLDLACGHAQDLLKYMDKDLSLLVGIDISPVEIRQAQSRYMELLTQRTIKFGAEYRSGDLLISKTYEFLKGNLFDVISIQLAMHYLMINIDSARAFLKQISAHIKPGGFFIGTTSCSKVIKDRLCNGTGTRSVDENGKTVFSFGNNIYKVTFDAPTFQKLLGVAAISDSNLTVNPSNNTFQLSDLQKDNIKFNSEYTWGCGYRFWLKDLISNAFEYNIPWKAFSDLALAEFDLELVEDLNFSEVLAAGSEYSDRLQSWIQQRLSKGPKILMKDNEFEAFTFYKAFVFRKTGGAAFVDTLQRTQANFNSNSQVSRNAGEADVQVIGRKKKRKIAHDDGGVASNNIVYSTSGL